MRGTRPVEAPVHSSGDGPEPRADETEADEREGVGDSLRSIYDEVLAETIPDEMMRLLEQLR
jgi:hypothetical protein